VIAAPKHGFVFLSVTKTASTSIEEALRPWGQIITQGEPRTKHLNYVAFERFIQPWLEQLGYPRDAYEVVCVVREPIDWLHSWWRFRGREELARPKHRRHPQYTGEISFDDFATAYVRGDPGYSRVGRQARFVRGQQSEIGVNRLFRFEELETALDYFRSKVGMRLSLERRNVSPDRPKVLAPDVESELREFLEPEYRIWGLADGRLLFEA
jgi:hypothetical protein